MPIFEITHDAITPVPMTTFESEGITERADLQRLLRSNIGAVVPECFVLAEEYAEWADAKRRIDLLCIDSDANLVVVELKRTEDAGQADLQAIRYAAMISLMTFDDAVNARAKYFKKTPDEAKQDILGFLNWDIPQKDKFAQDVRIILVSAEFSKEVTSTALWLYEKGLDVRCVRLKPYKVADKVLVDIQQIIPLPEATDYQNQLRKKEEEERQSRNSGAKRPNFRFSMIDIQPGTVLTHYIDPTQTCIVNDDQNVKFRGSDMSLTHSAGIVLKEKGRSPSVAGTDYWGIEKDGKWMSLSDLRDQAEKAKLSGQAFDTATVAEPK
jgi:RecB family endonuclease NucS